MESQSKDGVAPSTSPFMPMFERFRAELDEHHDRRERIIKASRDITAASKKIIFTLQRIRKLNEALPQHAIKSNKQYQDTIQSQIASVSGDLQCLHTYRYSRQISGGCQEWMEAACFQHYLETTTLLSYDDAAEKFRQLDEAGSGIELSPEDWLLGVYDMTGELMRFAITTMATTGELLKPSGSSQSDDDGMDVDGQAHRQRSVLTDLRELRAALESLNVGTGPFAKDCEKKLAVMQTSVEKVEKALYGLVVRGAERPKGWMPEIGDAGGGGRAVEVEG
ncbi:hypothetical protein BAUCODRAFT_149700 [Baudoinia panamericana UAMH 10762]|uniref:Translin n=1 Tax=Baudoinia panamericana (strain UAMH 10762) TaxID=717646 RepID=M2N6A4_BAUPA|nr:uncharacterized protein BAUCODRAFT_149700 [Baudoinia panamericana UAMH 10762]EMC94564.1 hypothetical protein BAUCODRAFT_149700 [Baudoinia panamericana UAMH 10762]